MAVDVGPPPGGGGPNIRGLTRQRPEHSLLALRRGGWLSADEVAGAQRAFLLEAVGETVGELGYARATVREVIARAGVSRITFYKLFEGVDDCLLAALTGAHERVLEAAEAGYADAGDVWWTDHVSHAVAAVLTLLEAQPHLAGLCVGGALTGPPDVVAVHWRFVDQLARGLAASAPDAEAADSISPLMARGLVAGAAAMIQEHLTNPARGDDLLGLRGEITRMLCGPFLSDQSDGAPTSGRRPHASHAGGSR